MDKVLAALSSIPATAWTAFGTALIAFFGVWLTNLNNRKSLKMQLEHDEKMHQKRQAKERLEELYSLVTHWVNAIFSDGLYLTLVMEGHKDYNSYLDIINEMHEDKVKSVDFSRLQMIIGIYGECIKGEFNNVIEVRDKIIDLKESHKQAYKVGESGARFLKPLSELQSELDSKAEVLLAAIARIAKQT